MCTTKRLVFASLLLVTTAHRVSAAPTGCAIALTPTQQLTTPPPCCRCACSEREDLERAALEAQARAAREALAVGLTLFIPAYLAGTAYAFSLPGSVRPIDSIPVFGSIIAGARDRDRDNHAALYFAGGAQLIGTFLAVLAAVELAETRERRWTIDVGAGPGSAQLSAKLRW